MKHLASKIIYVVLLHLLCFYLSWGKYPGEGTTDSLGQSIISVEGSLLKQNEQSITLQNDFFAQNNSFQDDEASRRRRDSTYFEIFNSFEIFSSAVAKILQNYLIELSPLDLIKFALEGITKQLDPYTAFYSDEDELNDIIKQNEYVGLGISVSAVDSTLIVEDFVDSLARATSGLKIGDKLIAIENVQLLGSLDTLRKYTDGNENTTVEIELQREGIDTIITIKTLRRKIIMPPIEYTKVFEIDGGKGLYVKIQQFTSEMPDELRSIIKNYHETTKNRKGIIIDLRDNPGGILEAAIQFCEIFLPPGTLIVTTRGREGTTPIEYKAAMAPLDTTTPLILLVNNGSASASEIVAGAIQDNDRGVIIGQRTFGKGLVQTIEQLPYNSYLKITTAKYLTPSGRSIHLNRYNSNASDKISNLYTKEVKFYTRNGRVVEESNGIQPDILIEGHKSPPFIRFLKSKMIFTLFASYLENTGNLSNDLVNNNKELKSEFIKFLKEKHLTFESQLEKDLDVVISDMKKENYPKSLIAKAESVKKEIRKSLEQLVAENFNQILDEIKLEINKRTESYSNSKYLTLQKDAYFQEALRILSHQSDYFKILGLEKN
jgi:carboxyl-terminal processing protease